MHFVTLLTLALTALTSTASAGTLHDRRRENLVQQMRRNKGAYQQQPTTTLSNLQLTSAAQPLSEGLSTPGSLIATTTALEGLNSTIGLNTTSVTETLITSELQLTSETAAVDASSCPPAVTVTVTETSVSTIQACKTQTGDENTSAANTDPAQTASKPTSTAAPTGDELFSPSNIVVPAPTESAAVEDPALEQPAPLEDGAITTQIITQTISSPAATIVSEFVTCRGRGKSQRCKVTSVTVEQEESVGVETVTLVVTQSDSINLVTSESGIANTPTAIVVDGIATETAAPVETPAKGEENAIETPVPVTDGNAALESSTSCEDAGVTLISVITVNPSASAPGEAASPTTAPILTSQNPVNENTISETAASSSTSITISAVAPDVNENIVLESMVTVITMTKSVVPIEVTFGTGATQETAVVTPKPETILSTITLGPGGITGTGTVGAPQATGGAGNGKGKGRGKDKKKKDKGIDKGKNGKGQDKGNGRENGAEEDEEKMKENDRTPDRNQNDAGERGSGNGKAEYDIFD